MSVRRAPGDQHRRERPDQLAATLGRLYGRRTGHLTSDACSSYTRGRLTVSFAIALAPYEQELIARGGRRLIGDARSAFQSAMAPYFEAVVAEQTGRRVLSQAASTGPAEHRCRLTFVLVDD